jgi:protein gp37
VDAPRRFFGEKYWNRPLTSWNRDAQAAGERRRVFCASMADVFEIHRNQTTQTDLNAARSRLWDLIEQTDWLDWLLLTKRPENVMGYIPAAWRAGHMPSNVLFGTSVENQEQADLRIPHLLRVPDAVRFLSVEPLLGPVDITGDGMGLYESAGPEWAGMNRADPGIDWVIVGGESGPGARPMHADWARSLRDQCVDAGVAFNFKQWGEWIGVGQVSEARTTGNETLHPWPDGRVSARVGKKIAGRLLDGREWNEFPDAQTTRV